MEIPINQKTVTIGGIIAFAITIIIFGGYTLLLFLTIIASIIFLIYKLEKKGIKIIDSNELSRKIRGLNTNKLNRNYHKYKNLQAYKKNTKR